MIFVALVLIVISASYLPKIQEHLLKASDIPGISAHFGTFVSSHFSFVMHVNSYEINYNSPVCVIYLTVSLELTCKWVKILLLDFNIK